jgi:flagellar protein FliO/FliZ
VSIRRNSLFAMTTIALSAAPAIAQDGASPVGAASVLQVLTGLALVLLLVVGTAWLLRRVGRVPGLSNQSIRTIGAAAVGTRERVVLLEVGATWILVGVAPGHVRPLATLPKGEVAAVEARTPGETAPFGALLKRLTEGRNHAA